MCMSIQIYISIDIFSELGEVTAYRNTVSANEVIERTKDADIVVANKCPINKESLDASKNVKLVCEFATGYDNCDLEYLKSRGIPVCNVVNYSTDMVAQHTFTLALAVSQSLSYYDDYVKSEKYVNDKLFTHFEMHFNEITNKTWGIIGLGAIGKRVAEIATCLGANVVYYSTSGKNHSDIYKEVDFDTLLSTSDVISIHAPLDENTFFTENSLLT